MAQDLGELKALSVGQSSDEVVRLLHRIRGALAVGKAKSLIQLCRELEIAVARDGLAHTHADVAAFIQRVECAIEIYKLGMPPRSGRSPPHKATKPTPSRFLEKDAADSYNVGDTSASSWSVSTSP
ncbi:hypothetical protein E3O56_19530 [Pseudomonas sp. W2Aug9]|nr:hypothetical protein [Pseudomonas sp. W2Aug9]UEH11079.1 Hpt domain-containing protein [Pseudomonas sp. HN8-3]